MTAVADPTDAPPKKASKLPLILGVVLALAGGGGGFYAVSSGLLLGSGDQDDAKHADDKSGDHAEAGDYAESGDKAAGFPAFVPIEPLVISIQDVNGARFLRFSAQLEVGAAYKEEVAAVMPRIVDVVNSYLRAVTLDEFSDPAILNRMRGQLLRRIQVATGQGRVKDLLIMEFVLN